MPVFALGLNHVTAPLSVRDRLAFAPDSIAPALMELTQSAGFAEATILSTCNRVEVYAAGEGDPAQLLGWLAQHRRVSAHELNAHLYLKRESDAVRHVMRVASGLDSMVLGEPQILGQLKEAFAIAQTTGTVGSELSRLFQQSFAVAKQVRTDTAIGASAVSVAYAAVKLSKRIFADLAQTTVLFVGAGETIQLCAQHLAQQGVTRMIVANRTVTRAQELARAYGGEAIALHELPEYLPRADIVISSTASPLPIIGKGLIERVIKARKRKPVFMVDLAVPRDIEPEVATLDDVYLYTVDDLNGVVQENLKARQEAALQAEEIITAQVEQFALWQHSRNAVDTIRDLRASLHRIQEYELARAMARLNNGDSAADVLKQFSHRLSNKFLHVPSERLRDAAGRQQNDMIDAVRQVFDLDLKSFDNGEV